MAISNDLLCLYTTELEKDDGKYVVKIPERELAIGALEAGDVIQIGVLSANGSTDRDESEAGSYDRDSVPSSQDRTRDRERRSSRSRPPVSEGEEYTVDIEGTGKQGDGVARVSRGFVVIVPGAEKGERVRIKINRVKENVAFADVIERKAYYR